MKCMSAPPTLFQRNFDADQFDRIKVSIQKEIEGAKSVENLMRQLKHIYPMCSVSSLQMTMIWIMRILFRAI